MIALDYNGLQLKLKRENDKTLVFDPVRKKWLVLTPEEHIRQYMILYLSEHMAYPPGAMSVEKKVLLGKIAKRFDLIVYDRNHQPWMLVECKAPEVAISETTLFQLLNYQNAVQCRYWLLTNGHQTFCADAIDIHNIKWLDQLPPYNI